MDSDYQKYVVLGGATTRIPGSTSCDTQAHTNAFIIIYDAATDISQEIFPVNSGSTLLDDQYLYMPSSGAFGQEAKFVAG